MVKSIDPRYNDYRKEDGRVYDNAGIGERMMAAYIVSLHEFEGSFGARHRPAQAVLDLLKAAKKRARREGKPVTLVLREHMLAVEDNYDDAGRQGRMLRAVTEDNVTRVEGSDPVQDEMGRQDDRRKQHRLTETTYRAALLVEGIEASRTIIPHPTVVQLADGTTVQRGELARGGSTASSSSGGTGVLALPARRHEMGGMVPNADQMHLALQLREAPDPSPQSSAPLMLEHRQQLSDDARRGGGARSRAGPDGDGEQKEGPQPRQDARAESALVLAARLVAQLSDAHARGQRL